MYVTVERGIFDASVSVRVLDVTCKYQQTVRHLAAGLLNPLDLSLSPQPGYVTVERGIFGVNMNIINRLPLP